MLKLRCPIDTRNLYNNGISSAERVANGWVIVIGGPVAPYAPFISLKGTHNMVPNPWVEQAVSTWKHEIESQRR